MFLKSLKIANEVGEVRNISFGKGINLIVDNTPNDDEKQSGNNVGKTTVLRLIDFCLGGDGKNIYKDTEFKNKSNNLVEDWLKETKVNIELILSSDLSDPMSDNIIIERNFLSRSEKVQMVDGEPYTLKEFPKILKERIFSYTKLKPSFRQIISKNIRDERNRLVNTVKVLHATTTKQEYEALFLFWLGIELDSADRKQKLIALKGIEKKLQKKLKKENSLSQIEQSIIVVDRSIRELEIKRTRIKDDENIENDLQELGRIVQERNELVTKIGATKLRKNLIEESIINLQDSLSSINVNEIKEVYRQAKLFLPNLEKSFEETLKFHNSMIEEKIKFIKSELPLVEAEISLIQNNIDSLILDENRIRSKFANSEAVIDIEKLVVDLNKLYEYKGALEEQKRLWTNSIDAIKKISSELNQIDEVITNKDEVIQERVAEFNKYFSKISNKLYGEQFVLSADLNDAGYELNITSISGNLGTGKKKGQIAAFDIAYIQFADEMDIDCLHFILHDQIETVHGNQIVNLLSEVVSNSNCQYIAPILDDKLPEELKNDSNIILVLSQNDKLFKI